MLAYQGKHKKLVKVHRMENGVVYLTEEPPGSGMFYLPLVENGKNVEEFEILEQEQMSLLVGRR
ncbi:MAG: hypothetical protein WC082_16580 [Victivallales bacterium]